MASLTLTAKRELLAQVYSQWVNSVTGSRPHIGRTASGIKISLSDNQKKLMANSIVESMNSKPSPDDLNVSMDWGGILIPVFTKKYLALTLGTVAGLITVGMLIIPTLKRKMRKRKRKK